ncbi:MAG TPA: ABC transporter permease [Acidimicrobiales bacterium]|nr:ABC transporter permease [Acidimicrobiales bacterium]
MSWADAFRLAARSVLRRRGRAALTIGAVALAAALFTAMLTMAETAQGRVLNQLAKGGPLAGIQVSAAASDPSQLGLDNPTPGPPKALDQTALSRITRLPGVSSVLPIVTAQTLVIWPQHALTTPRGEAGPGGSGNVDFDEMVGVDLAHATDLPITVTAGRLPKPGSLTEVDVTSVFLARYGIARTHATSALGSVLELRAPRGFLEPDGSKVFRSRQTEVKIVGVVAQQVGTGGILASLSQAQANHAWTAAGDPSVDPDAPKSPYTGLFVIAVGLDQVPSLRAAIATIGYSTSAPENLIASVERYVHVVEIVLGGIGVIALAIASLGIANALLAAVRERRREIGILKAVGARDRDVLRTFLIEAGVMGAVGGLIGSILGLALAALVAVVVNGYLASQGLAGVRVGIPYLLGVGATIGSVVLALLAGTFPARRAARLPAREAVEL